MASLVTRGIEYFKGRVVMLKDLVDCQENLILIGGRPETGKTRMCLELINLFEKRGEKILFYSLENPEKTKLLKRDVRISNIVNYIKGPMLLNAVFVDYFQLLNFDAGKMEEEILFLINSAKERSVKVYMFFMLNRKFDENSPDLSCFEYKNSGISKFFERVCCLKKTGDLISLKTNTTDHCQ
jgi:replicative DNA helicase